MEPQAKGKDTRMLCVVASIYVFICDIVNDDVTRLSGGHGTGD